MEIKTRESQRTIKTFDRAGSLTQKSRNGLSSLNHSSEETQNVGYDTESEYAGNILQNKEKAMGRGTVYGARRMGKWGIHETRSNLHRVSERLKRAKRARQRQQAIKAGAKAAKITATTAVKIVKGAIKATAAALKGIASAIAAGGWIAVLIILVICIVGLVAGSVYGIFLPAENDGISIYDVKRELDGAYRQAQEQCAADCPHDFVYYEGSPAEWKEVLAVYAVKLNLDSEHPQELVTFHADKADALRAVFWDMTDVRTWAERWTETVTRLEQDGDGNLMPVTEDVPRVTLHIVTEHRTAGEMADCYAFSAEQRAMLTELLCEKNAELWEGILSE